MLGLNLLRRMVISYSRPILLYTLLTKVQNPMMEHVVRTIPRYVYDYALVVLKINLFFLTVNEVKDDRDDYIIEDFNINRLII